MGALLLLALPVHLATSGPSSGAAPAVVSDGSGPIDTAADLEPALHFERLVQEHNVNGMYVPLGYKAWPHINPGAQPWRMEGEGDSGNYTGVYLASQSWRYAQAKAELRKLGTDPLGTGDHPSEAVRFWRGQRDEARARAAEMIRYFHILINIAKYWNTHLNPTIDPDKDPTEFGWIDFGGGVFPAEAGLLMRTCTPEDSAPRWRDLRNNFEGLEELIGPIPWEDGRNWYCVGSTSRDSYAGTIFGLSVAFDFFGGPENAELKAMAGHDLMAMTDYAAKYLWFQVRPHGKIANPVFGHNDLTGPVSPLFIQVPLPRLHLVATARHAAKTLGLAEPLRRYEVLRASELAASVLSGALLDQAFIDSSNPHDAHYKFQLNLMSFFNVIRLEEDPLIRNELLRALAVQDATTGDDGNAFYEGLMYALTGDQAKLTMAVEHHRQWLDYYAFHEATARRGVTPFLHTPRCALTEPAPPGAPIEQQPLECVPKDQVDVVIDIPGVGPTEFPHRPGTEGIRAKEPLPVGVRRLADFLWQKDPTIVTGDHDTPWRGPSIDFISTYWIIRYYSEVAQPAATPMPGWLGVRFT